MSRSRRVLRALAWAPLAAWVLFEEWGWRPLSRAVAKLARWLPFARLEARLRSVSPPVALALFVVPALALLPVKLLALWLIHGGRGTLGLGVIVATKLLGTALLGRLFVLTEPQLRRYGWLARMLDAWAGYKQRVMQSLRALPAWRRARRGTSRLRFAFRRWRRHA